MKNIIIGKLEDELVKLLEELSQLDSSTDEYDKHLSKISKLYKTLNDEKQLGLDECKVEVEKDRLLKDYSIKRDQIEDGSKKFEAEVDIKKEQLKLDEKRIIVDAQKMNDELDYKDRQLKMTADNFEVEMELKEKELERAIADVLADRDMKLSALKGEKWFNAGKIVIEGLAIGAPLVFYNAWMYKGFKFEEEGTIGSPVFKGLISKFKTTR